MGLAQWTKRFTKDRSLDRELKRVARIESIKHREKAWCSFWAHLKELPVPVQGRVGYEVAKMAVEKTDGRYSADTYAYNYSGIALPFARHGLTMLGEWEAGDSYVIRRECFAGRDPLLYYRERRYSDFRMHRRSEEEEQERRAWIASRLERGENGPNPQLSVGLKDWDVRVVSRERDAGYQPHDGEGMTHDIVVTFRLDDDPAPVGEEVRRVYENSWQVHGDKLCDHIVMLKGLCETDFEFGEIVDGKMIPLLLDDVSHK